MTDISSLFVPMETLPCTINDFKIFILVTTPADMEISFKLPVVNIVPSASGKIIFLLFVGPTIDKVVVAELDTPPSNSRAFNVVTVPPCPTWLNRVKSTVSLVDIFFNINVYGVNTSTLYTKSCNGMPSIPESSTI